VQQHETVAAAVVSPTEIVARVDIAEALKSDVGRGAILYLIAKAPGGGPPLAVVRHPASAIPDEVTIGDGDAMIAGRTLSAQTSLLLTARISQSGEPLARPGDIFGEIELQLPAEQPVTLTIDRRVAEK
jgi:cytochrome c-type biogenesis protein CcmH